MAAYGIIPPEKISQRRMPARAREQEISSCEAAEAAAAAAARGRAHVVVCGGAVGLDNDAIRTQDTRRSSKTRQGSITKSPDVGGEEVDHVRQDLGRRPLDRDCPRRRVHFVKVLVTRRHAAHAKIRDLDGAVGRHQAVPCRQVAVDAESFVEVRHPFPTLEAHANVHAHVEVGPFLAEKVEELAAEAQLEDDVDGRRGHDADELHDVGVVVPFQDVGLLQETPRVGHVLLACLDSDLAPVRHHCPQHDLPEVAYSAK